MLGQTLAADEFEALVAQRWASGRFIESAPQTAAWLRERALQQAIDAGYAKDAPDLDFRSQWLVGRPGLPGAIHIQAPAEQVQEGSLSSRNRAPHLHDSGRISLITRGRATLYVARQVDGRPRMLVCPVQEGDLIYWPAWTAHTFDAGHGFWLVSAMARYVSPAADGFVLPIDHHDHGDPDVLPRMSYAEHLTSCRDPALAPAT